MRRLILLLFPFFFLGCLAVLFVVGFILFFYLVVAGALVGLILFLIAWVRERFFTTKQAKKIIISPKRGRTFEHEK